MRERRLLFLDAAHLAAYRWSAGALTDEHTFAADPPGIAEFARYVGHAAGSVFYLLAELADEAFQFDNVPFVRGRDRSTLIERKLDQHCYGTLLRLALPLGRDKTGRRDEKLLFAALTRPAAIEPWLATLRDQQARVKGIYTPALLAANIVNGRLRAGGPALMVTITSGGIRQTLFDGGLLRFSRLTALPGGQLAQAPDACALECAKVHQYLLRQRLIARETPLTALLLVHPEQAAAFRDHCRDSADLRFEMLDLAAEARRHALKTPLPDSRSDMLFMHLMVRKPTSAQFAPPAIRRHYTIGRLRAALPSAAASIFAACLLASAMELVEYGDLRQKTAAIRSLAEQDGARYEAIRRASPPLPDSVDNMRAVVASYEALQSASSDPLPMYRRISRALEDAPAIQINRIDWRADAEPDEPQPERRAASPATKPAIVADVYGEVDVQRQAGAASDERTLLAAIQGFAAELGREPGIEVTARELPFDIDPGKSLKTTAASRPAAHTVGFVLRLRER